jgi:hypothetical protein
MHWQVSDGHSVRLVVTVILISVRSMRWFAEERCGFSSMSMITWPSVRKMIGTMPFAMIACLMMMTSSWWRQYGYPPAVLALGLHIGQARLIVVGEWTRHFLPVQILMSNDVELGRWCQERVSPRNERKMNNITSRSLIARMLLTVERLTVFRYHSICHAAMPSPAMVTLWWNWWLWNVRQISKLLAGKVCNSNFWEGSVLLSSSICIILVLIPKYVDKFKFLCTNVCVCHVRITVTL